jgi:fatty acid desaturase
MGRIIIGLIIMAIGVFFVARSEKLLENFGRIAFFERYLGAEGGSRLGYKLLGIIIVFIGLITTLNLSHDFLSWLTAPLTRGRI